MKEELKVGRWYKLSSGRTKLDGEWYMKLGGIKGNLVMGTEYILNRLYQISKDSSTNFGNIGTYNYELVNLQEIRQYLPDLHPDKLLSISKEQKKNILQLIREI